MQVVIPLSLQRRVEGLLQEHIDRTQLISGKAENILDGTNSSDMVEDVNLDENPDSFLDGSVMEKVLQRRSLRMRNMQRAWQVSFRVLFSFLLIMFLYICGKHSLFQMHVSLSAPDLKLKDKGCWLTIVNTKKLLKNKA